MPFPQEALAHRNYRAMPRAQSNPAVALKERSRVPPQGSNTFGRVAGRASAGGLFPRPNALALFLVPTLCPFFSSLRSAWGRVPWPLRGLFLFGEENLPRAANPREVGVAGSQGWTQERPHLRPHALALLLVLRSAWGRVPWPLRGLFLFGERTSRGLQTRGRLGLREVRVGRRSVRTSAPTRNVGVRGSVRGAACAPPEGQRSHRSRLGRAPPPVSAFAWPCQFL